MPAKPVFAFPQSWTRHASRPFRKNDRRSASVSLKNVSHLRVKSSVGFSCVPKRATNAVTTSAVWSTSDRVGLAIGSAFVAPMPALLIGSITSFLHEHPAPHPPPAPQAIFLDRQRLLGRQAVDSEG